MTKKTLNQNAKYVQELIKIIEPDFIFKNKPLNRFKTDKNLDYKKRATNLSLFNLGDIVFGLACNFFSLICCFLLLFSQFVFKGSNVVRYGIFNFSIGIF